MQMLVEKPTIVRTFVCTKRNFDVDHLCRPCYDRRGSPGLTTFGRVRTCPAGNSGAKTDRVRVSNGRPAKGIH